MATIMNPHTGLPVEFSEVDPYGFQALLMQAGLMGSGGTGENVGGERQRGISNQQRSANLGAAGAFDPAALAGFQTGTGRQDYNATDYLLDPSGNLVAQQTYEDRNNEREAAAGLAAFFAMMGGANLMGVGQGGAAAGSAAASAAPAVVDPIAAYLTTGAVEGSTLGTALSGAGGASGAVGAGTFASGLQGLGGVGTFIDSASRAAAGLPQVGGGSFLGNAASAVGSGARDLVSGGAAGGGSTIGRIVAPALGAIAGGIDAARGSEDTTTQQSRLDPNMQRLLYGDNGQGGLLNQANAFFQANRGINPTAQQGLNMSKAFFTDPSYAQGYGQLRSQGLGLLGQPVAGNPFARG
jgi:hypothetical protein